MAKVGMVIRQSDFSRRCETVATAIQLYPALLDVRAADAASIALEGRHADRLGWRSEELVERLQARGIGDLG